MIKGTFPIEKFRELETPFYYYDLKVLRDTLNTINQEVSKYENFHVHYAIKANANPKILKVIRESGLGVSRATDITSTICMRKFARYWALVRAIMPL